ncbi:MAG: trimeric intracellular cation channel family protein [Lachnotalea sp.]
MDGITVLEYIGIIAFAISGVNIAIEEQFDLLGIYILGIITAMGGGIIRDIVTQEGIPVFFHSYNAILVIFITCTITIILKGKWKGTKILILIDAIGLAAFVVSSGMKAIDNHYNLILFLFVTSITGVGGGLLRDIITNRKPVVFQSDIYCIAGIIGALVLRITFSIIGMFNAGYLALGVVITVRMVCYKNNIHLPKISCLCTNVDEPS